MIKVDIVKAAPENYLSVFRRAANKFGDERFETVVRRSELEWIIVRPMLLTNGPWTDAYRARADLKPGRRPYVSRADVADFLMRQLSNHALVRKTPAIGY